MNKKNQSELPKTLGFIITFAGVFFLVASLFSLLTLFVLQAAMSNADSFSSDEKYAAFLTITTILITISAMYIGVKLIKQLDIGRKLFNILTVIVITLSWAKFAYQENEITKSFANKPPELVANAMQIELNSALSVFILPAIMLVVALLLNIRSSKNALSS